MAFLTMGQFSCCLLLLVIIQISKGSFPNAGRGYPDYDTNSNNNNNGHDGHESNDGNKRISGETPSHEVLLSATPECSSDLKRICSKGDLSNNFAILDCIQNDRRDESKIEISQVCHHKLWSFKKNLTTDGQIEQLAHNICPSLLKSKCSNFNINGQQQDEKGYLLSCLIDHMEDPSVDMRCKILLTRLETIIFSDYRLIYKFTESCDADIQKFNCGRLETSNSADDNDSSDGSGKYQSPSTQGKTIECLETKSDQLRPECKKEILRIAELQSDDFHLDRPLYFACRDDREKFCPRVQAGDGRIYRCLMKHKTEAEMSNECHDQLFRREMMVVNDFRTSKGLVQNCHQDIKSYQCRQETSDRRDIRLAQIILCLENAMSLGHPVDCKCKSEILIHRQQLMSNYQLTPILATLCEKELSRCGKHFEGNGKTLHCLMSQAKDSWRDQNQVQFSPGCKRAIEDLLKETNPAEDWRVDPVLQSSCQSSVDKLCSNIKSGEGRVMSCLMDHIDSTQLHPKCRETLILIQYFISREFNLDAPLYKTCHDEAHRYCHAKKDWHHSMDMDPERGPTIISCLYRYAYHPEPHMRLSQDCLTQVKRVMKIRAQSVDLQPEIEEPCIPDLTNFCSDDSEELVKRGFEMECLQENFEKLTPGCKEAVGNYTEDESEDIELNPHLVKECSVIIKEFCHDPLKDDNSDDGDIMECLILNKNKELTKKHSKCRMAIEHFQLISLKDYRFSHKFKEYCKSDVLKYCKNVRSKSDVVFCLSTIAFNDTMDHGLNRKNHRLKVDCRNQLKTELFERNENIKLDPELSRSCELDRKKFCSDLIPGESVITECLKENMRKLSKTCHKLLFSREKLEMTDNSIDYHLMTSCKSAINKFCETIPTKDVLYCLRDVRNHHEMDTKCKAAIMRRLTEQNSDWRLNTRLKNSCTKDIPKFCSSILNKNILISGKSVKKELVDVTKVSPDQEMEGQVIECLKKQYVKNRLTASCEAEILNIIRETSENYELDPILVRSCDELLKSDCSPQELSNSNGQQENPEECLKRKFQQNQIKSDDCKREVARVIFESKSDIESDPILYKICSNDINNKCSHIPSGHGRQLSCLISQLETDNLKSDCKFMLRNRVAMFESAALVLPNAESSAPESVADVYHILSKSPSAGYFMMMFCVSFLLVFLGGSVCGRYIKSVPDSVKNK